jgi:2'-5' RNA ligase
MRSFVAVEIPQEIRRGLASLQGELGECGSVVQWVRPEAIHLTLKFLGEIDPARVEAIRHAAGRVVGRHPPFPLRVAGMGCFPGFDRPRVVWVGLTGDEGRLQALQGEMESCLEGLGFPRETRPFRPHLTLGRVRSPRGRDRLLARIQGLMGLELGRFDVTTVTQFRSELRPSGARYTPLWEARLGGGRH